jgi:hypothetical protein
MSTSLVLPRGGKGGLALFILCSGEESLTKPQKLFCLGFYEGLG